MLFQADVQLDWKEVEDERYGHLHRQSIRCVLRLSSLRVGCYLLSGASRACGRTRASCTVSFWIIRVLEALGFHVSLFKTHSFSLLETNGIDHYMYVLHASGRVVNGFRGQGARGDIEIGGFVFTAPRDHAHADRILPLLNSCCHGAAIQHFWLQFRNFDPVHNNSTSSFRTWNSSRMSC